MMDDKTMLARIAELEAALRGLSDMYSHAWDLVAGGLVMQPPSIPRFEEAHRVARIALGHPFVGDDGSDPDAAAALGEKP
jgi:hypothetical protein